MTITHTNPPTALGEPDAHANFRHMQTAIRGLLIVASVATIALFLTNRPATLFAAIPIPALIIISAIVGYFERRSRASVLRHPGQSHITKQELEADVQSAGIVTGLKVGVALALGTFIAAASVFDLATLGIGATVLLVLAILIEIPYLALFVTEAEREELETVRPQTHADQSSEKPSGKSTATSE
ncbi:hypothetical protein [Aureliella helgolandensis]|uniref:Uncharacterized protein n=1 Tax=Aureliella helgolandensis TaxID=2527968 RepID=A0A518G7T6_9BACT|nr:hypothetical protein [Aureliella helgolandensis]QDV24648.1 hypothetical protein Q31a_29680 [Aureliella helgolandensis]